MKYFWMVKNGDVTQITDLDNMPDADGVEAIIARAEDEATALRIADAYDAGEVEYGNIMDNGRVIIAIDSDQLVQRAR